MTGVLVVTHLLAAAVGALCAGAWMRWHRMAKRRAVREVVFMTRPEFEDGEKKWQAPEFIGRDLPHAEARRS